MPPLQLVEMWSPLMLLLLSGFLNYFVCCKLPPETDKCTAGDEKCIVDIINHIFRKYPKGLPDIGLEALDSIDLRDVVISDAVPDTPMQMSLKFNTVTMRGFENTTILRAKGFERELQRGFELGGWTPLVRLDGIYEADGKLLMLPVQGKGQAQIEFKDGQFACKVKTAEDHRMDGKLYAKITKVKCLVDAKGLHVNFDNLLNNKELSDSINELINNNWQDVWYTMRQGVNLAVSQVAETYLKSVFNKLAYNDFFKQV